MKAVGIDLSLTGTAIVALGDSHALEIWARQAARQSGALITVGQEFAAVRLKTNDMGQYERWRTITDAVIELAAGADIVVIEGYAYGAPFAREAMAEIGGIVRYSLKQILAVDPLIVQPLILKKFLLGTAKADKDLILKELLKRYGVDVDDHNMADAYVMAKIGEAYRFGTEGLPQFRVDIIEQLKNGKPKKKKKKEQ